MTPRWGGAMERKGKDEEETENVKLNEGIAK